MTTQCKNPNESNHKQTGKKKIPNIFWVTKQKIFPRNPTQYFGHSKFLKKSRFSIQTNTKKITTQIKNPF